MATTATIPPIGVVAEQIAKYLYQEAYRRMGWMVDGYEAWDKLSIAVKAPYLQTAVDAIQALKKMGYLT